MLVPEAVHIRSFGPEYVCVVRTHVADAGVTPKLKVEDYRQRGNKKSVCVCVCISTGNLRQYYSSAAEVHQFRHRTSPQTHTHTHCGSSER